MSIPKIKIKNPEKEEPKPSQQNNSQEESPEITNSTIYVIEKTTVKGFRSDISEKDKANLVFPNGVKEISDSTFENDKCIQKITIPKSVEKIGGLAFNGCTKLSGLKFDPSSSLQIIGSCVFSGTNIKTVKIPKSVKIIDAWAFGYCKELSVVEFEPGSKSEKISKFAFVDTALKEIKIPKSVKKISGQAFNDCPHLSVVEFEGGSNRGK